jgi:hypothetical protein
MTPRPEDPCRDPASEMRDDHFDPDDENNLEGRPPTPEERAAEWRELNRIAPTPADKMALMMSFQNEQEPDDYLDDDDPLWLVDVQIRGLLEGHGATEDHESVLTFLRGTGLHERTVVRVHRAIVGAEKNAAELAEARSQIAATEINTNTRLFDLVRYMRSELHEDGLVTDKEYYWLCAEAPMSKGGGSPSPRRLEGYDRDQRRIRDLEGALTALRDCISETRGTNAYEALQRANTLLKP